MLFHWKTINNVAITKHRMLLLFYNLSRIYIYSICYPNFRKNLIIFACTIIAKVHS